MRTAPDHSKIKKVSEPIAWRTSLIYWLISALWILVSDRLLAAFVADAKTISVVQSYKGWGFVTVTAFFLYAGLRAQLNRWRDASLLRTEVERNLLASEERLRLATEVASMGSWERNLRTGHLHWSPSLEKMNGFAPGTFPGTFDALRKLVHPDDLKVMDDGRRSAIEGDGEYQVELRFKRRDGGFRWGLVRGKVLCGPDGKPDRIVGIELDITDRKETELAGQRRLELEAQLSRLAATVPGAIYSFRVRPDGRYHFPYASAKFSEMFGLDSKLLEQDAALAFGMIHGDDLAGVQASIQESAKLLAPWRKDFRAIVAGREIWLEGSSVPQAEADGGVLWHGFLIDVTQRKRIEAFGAGQRKVLEMIASGATLKETLDVLLRLVEARLEGAVTSILLLDEDGQHLRHGAAPSLPAEYTLAIDGLQIGPQVGSCGTAAYCRKPVFVENIAESALWVDFAALALKHGLRACWSTPVSDAQGAVVGTFAIYYGQPRLPEPGHLEVIEEISHLAAICILKTRTLTRMRRSEERFRSLIENGSDLITVVNNAGLIRYESPSAQRLMGYEPDEMIGRPALEVIHPDDAALVQAALQRALTMPNAPASVEYRLRHRDGTWRTFESVGRSAPGEAAEGFVIVNSRDVTEPRALEAQLRQAQKMEAMGTLAGGIAHDFNNILTAILGNVELARWDLQKPTEVELGLSEITKAATRAKDLVRQILTFSRQQVQQRSVIPLGPVIEECASMLRATMPHSVEFKLALQKEVPLVRADATQIHQVMLNLCTNAWHALPDSRGCIEVKLGAVELAASVRRRLAALPDGPCVALSVCDNGIGMTAATLERIYEPFFTTKEPGKGTGLGLSVVHGIVLAHEGVIEVESAPGQGTSFRIYFPAAIEDQARSMAAPPSPAAGGRLRIFYVDDEEALVRVGSRMLERLGFEVHGYVRPDEALASFRAAPDQVDAVVTDFNMPAISGLTLATEMLAIRPGLCVILSSGYVSEELHQRAQTVGIRRVIHKPNTLEQLAQALRDLMAEQ